MSKKLKTNIVSNIINEIDNAQSLLYKWFDPHRVGNKDDFSKLLDFEYFLKENKTATPTVKRLFNIIVDIYKKTGSLLHQDLGSYNLGYDWKNDLNVLDYGYPVKPF